VTQRLLISDTETTGFNPTKDGIVEIAFVEVSESLIELSRFEKIVNPNIPISASASATHGLTDKDVLGCPTVEEALKRFEPDYFEDVFLIAHNAQFDLRFLKKYWQITGIFCTLKAARFIYPEAPDHKLGTLRYWLKLDNDLGVRKDILAHSALSDVEVTLTLLKRMVKNSGLTLPQLHEEIYKPKKITHMTFGKLKGTKLEDLPKKYVTWLLTLKDLDVDLRNSLVKIKG